MLDARLMEVYTAAYDRKLRAIADPSPVILTETIPFSNLDPDRRVYYFGPGAAKCQEILAREGRFAFLDGVFPDAEIVAQLGLTLFLEGKTVDSASFEPDYLKAFQGKPPAKAAE
jgi:tRNA threonylcarbamoyladenosine biosynthesis protein TsaB